MAPLADIVRDGLAPAMALLPPEMDSVRAWRLLVAIHLQEDPRQRRRQWPTGPARGLLQFERIGVAEVLQNTASARYARQLCGIRAVEPTVESVWAALQFDDVLAFGVARLALWRDPRPLPTDEQGGWLQYIRIWAPGKPRPEKWPANWARALEAVG
jgi:hypothetical protein